MIKNCYQPSQPYLFLRQCVNGRDFSQSGFSCRVLIKRSEPHFGESGVKCKKSLVQKLRMVIVTDKKQELLGYAFFA